MQSFELDDGSGMYYNILFRGVSEAEYNAVVDSFYGLCDLECYEVTEENINKVF